MYDPACELNVDVTHHSLGSLYQAAASEYRSFYSEFSSVLDLERVDSIFAVYDEAKRRGIFKLAEDVRMQIFGKDMHFYGVCYLWDTCVEKCVYCPAALDNRARAGYSPRMLTVEEAVLETQAIMDIGHTHVCYLAGEDLRPQALDFLIACLKEIDQLGLSEIILNISPKDDADFRTIRKAVKETSLQFRVFQESYDRVTYSMMHPKGEGRKHDFDYRLNSQCRAMQAGFDNYGLGVLFGLHRYPLEEIHRMVAHSTELIGKVGRPPARVCLPFANQPESIDVNIPYRLDCGDYGHLGNLVAYGPYEMTVELVYALAKLSLPNTCIVSSERDRPGLLEVLDRYATCTTLNANPGVGDNALYSGNAQPVHFRQASVYHRSSKDTLKRYRERGFNPIITKLFLS